MITRSTRPCNHTCSYEAALHLSVIHVANDPRKDRLPHHCNDLNTYENLDNGTHKMMLSDSCKVDQLI